MRALQGIEGTSCESVVNMLSKSYNHLGSKWPFLLLLINGDELWRWLQTKSVALLLSKVRCLPKRHFPVSSDIFMYRFIALTVKWDIKRTSMLTSGRKSTVSSYLVKKITETKRN